MNIKKEKSLSIATTYSDFLNKNWMKRITYLLLNIFPFFCDIYRNGKIVEFSSFVVWELIHKLRLFRENKYISFNNIEALSIERGWIDDLNFIENANIFFNNRKLRIIKDYHAWKILFIDSFGNIWGCLFSNDNILYKSIDKGKSIILIKKFQRRIESIFITSQDTLFICVKGAVYRSIDRGRSFEKSLNFSSSESYFIFNNGMTETQEKTLIIGEYGDIWNKNHWKALAYLYYSTDNGGSWEKSDFLIKKGINKHVHLVRYSKLLNKILLTDGDNKKKLWISNLLKPDEKNLKWKLVNRFHIQTGGHTSVVESEKKIFFGSDYLGGTNFIVETKDCKKFMKKVIPDPYRRNPILNLIQRKSKRGDEIWAILHNWISDDIKSLLMYTVNDGESWTKVFEYNISTHAVKLIQSSSKISPELYISITTKSLEKNKSIVYKIIDY